MLLVSPLVFFFYVNGTEILFISICNSKALYLEALCVFPNLLEGMVSLLSYRNLVLSYVPFCSF